MHRCPSSANGSGGCRIANSTPSQVQRSPRARRAARRAPGTLAISGFDGNAAEHGPRAAGVIDVAVTDDHAVEPSWPGCRKGGQHYRFAQVEPGGKAGAGIVEQPMPAGVDQDGTALPNIENEHPHFPVRRPMVQDDQPRGIERQARQHGPPVARAQEACEREQAGRELRRPDRQLPHAGPIEPLQIAEQRRQGRIRADPAKVRQGRQQNRGHQAGQHQRHDNRRDPGDGVEIGESRDRRRLPGDECHQRRHAQHHDPLCPRQSRHPAVRR